MPSLGDLVRASVEAERRRRLFRLGNHEFERAFALTALILQPRIPEFAGFRQTTDERWAKILRDLRNELLGRLEARLDFFGGAEGYETGFRGRGQGCDGFRASRSRSCSAAIELFGGIHLRWRVRQRTRQAICGQGGVDERAFRDANAARFPEELEFENPFRPRAADSRTIGPRRWPG